MEQANLPADEQRHAERDQETRRRVLKAAERLFLTRGFKGVSMKDIAEEVQVTSAALYYHFPKGKVELFINVVQMISEELYASSKEAIAQTTNLYDRLTRLAEHQMGVLQQYRTFPELQRDIEQLCKDEPQKREIFAKLPMRFQHLLTEIFQEGIDTGEISADCPAHVLAWIYQGAFIGIQLGRVRLQSGPDELDAQEYPRLLVTILLNGMKKERS